MRPSHTHTAVLYAYSVRIHRLVQRLNALHGHILAIKRASQALQMPEKRSSEGSKEPTKQKPSGGGGGGASSTGQKRGRPPGIKEGKAIPKPPKPAVKSPVPKGQKVSGQKKAKEAEQTQATSTKSSGTASSFRHRRDSRTRLLGVCPTMETVCM